MKTLQELLREFFWTEPRANMKTLWKYCWTDSQTGKVGITFLTVTRNLSLATIAIFLLLCSGFCYRSMLEPNYNSPESREDMQKRVYLEKLETDDENREARIAEELKRLKWQEEYRKSKGN